MATSDTASEAAPAEAGGDTAGKPGGRKKLIIAAVAVLALLGIGGGAVMMGLPAKLFGGKAQAAAAVVETGSLDLPDIIANLNSGPRHNVFVKLKVRLELAKKTDEVLVLAAQGRILDLFQTYLRDMRPEELRGAAATYRLREELIARANIALAPARVTEILFLEMLIQ
jgi:flagellar FliL protein